MNQRQHRRRPQALRASRRRRQRLFRVRQRRAIVPAQDKHPQPVRPIPVESLAKRHDFARRLRHLLAAHLHHRVVHPVANKRIEPGKPLRLRDLVLVVREDQVHPAAVQVNLFSQVANRHRRALNVPARPTRPPRTLPLRLTRLRPFPQGEVHRVFFLDPDIRRLRRDHVIQRTPRQLPVARHLPHPEIHIAAGRIRHPLLDQSTDQIQHLRDLFRRPRMHIRRSNPQLTPLTHERRNLPLRQLRDRDPLLRRPSDQLVVHIREVVDQSNPPTPPLQEPTQRVENDDRHRMTQMSIVIRRDPADIHRDRIIQRRECLFPTSQRVVQLHGPTPKHNRIKMRPSSKA